MGQSLWEINKDIEELTEHLIDTETGEINDEVLQKLEQLELDQDEKLENYGLLMKNLQAEADALVKESKALKARADAKVAKIDRLKDIVTQTLHGKKKEFTRVKFSFRTSKSVNIVNEDLIPDDLCKIETKRTPRKTDIKKLLDAERDVPGCVLETNLSLQVK